MNILTDTLHSQGAVDAQSSTAVEGPNPVPVSHAPPVVQMRSAGGDGPNPLHGKITNDAQAASVVEGLDTTTGHRATDTHAPHAGGGPTPEQAILDPASTLAASVRGSRPPAPANGLSMPNLTTPVLADPVLGFIADALDDLERVRIANANRYGTLIRVGADKDGETRGFGLPEYVPEVARFAALVGAMRCERAAAAEKHRGCCLEHTAELDLRAQLRQHPLHPWIKGQRGVGDKQAARLLAAVGDPYWHSLYDRPRTVSELWAFCGYRPGQRRRRGERANWSGQAKKYAWLVADSCVKQVRSPCEVVRGDSGEYCGAVHVPECSCSPYRVVYDLGRAKYADSLHSEECARCGPAGKPALAGSPRSAAHQHAMAMRLAAKELLKDLWREGRRLYGVTEEAA